MAFEAHSVQDDPYQFNKGTTGSHEGRHKQREWEYLAKVLEVLLCTSIWSATKIEDGLIALRLQWASKFGP
eukprot:395190-Amphidinium_carterae.1